MIKLIKKLLIKPYLKNREYRALIIENERNFCELYSKRIIQMGDILDRQSDLKNELRKYENIEQAYNYSIKRCVELAVELDMANIRLQEK